MPLWRSGNFSFKSLMQEKVNAMFFFYIFLKVSGLCYSFLQVFVPEMYSSAFE